MSAKKVCDGWFYVRGGGIDLFVAADNGCDAIITGISMTGLFK